MKRGFLVGLAMVVFCVWVGVGGVMAQPVSDTTGKIGLAFRGSMMTTSSDTYQGRDIDRDNQGLLGLAVSYGVNRWLSLEVALDGSFATEIKDNTLGMKLADMHVYPFTLSAQIRYITSNPEFYDWIVPYLTFGIGYYFASGDVSGEYQMYHAPNSVNLNFDGGFGFHIGVGTDIFANKNFAIGFEARYFWASATMKEEITNPTLNVTQTHEEDIDLDSWMLGISVKLFFD